MVTTIVVTPSTVDPPADWPVERFREALRHAADAWSDAGAACAVKVVVAEPRSEWRATRDGTNLVVFRGRSWCHNERCGPSTTFPLRSTAMTTPYAGGDRRPAEADVEINAVAFDFTGGNPSGHVPTSKWSVPLEPVLVHELGHVLGLPDVCAAERRASGRPVTSACSASDRERVMFPGNRSGLPTPADVAELCGLYPAVDARVLAPAPATAVSPGALGGIVGLAITLAVVALTIAIGRRIRRTLRWIGKRARPPGRAARGNRSSAAPDCKALTPGIDTR